MSCKTHSLFYCNSRSHQHFNTERTIADEMLPGNLSKREALCRMVQASRTSFDALLTMSIKF